METDKEKRDYINGGQVESPDKDDLIENPFKRVVMVLFEPRLVFESVAVKSGRLDWIIPIICSLIVSLLTINAGYDYIRIEQINQAITQIESNTNLSAEQKEAMIEQTNQYLGRMAGLSRILMNITAVLGVFANAAIIGLVMFAVSRFAFGFALIYGDAFKIAALGLMVTAAGGLIELFLMILFESFTRSRITLGYFLPSGMEEGFLFRLLNIDLFIALYAVVICIGMSVFTKKTLFQTLTPMVILWFLFRAAVIGVSGMMSGIGA